MFNGEFEEGEEQIARLDLLEGVVSIRSFELLIQWIYVGQIIIGKSTPSEEIETLVEFARLADFCQVGGTEGLVTAISKLWPWKISLRMTSYIERIDI